MGSYPKLEFSTNQADMKLQMAALVYRIQSYLYLMVTVTH